MALGVAIDVPPHVLARASLDGMALIGHLIVLTGMVVVLVGLVLAALAVPRSHQRRTS